MIAASRAYAPVNILPLTYKNMKIVAENSTPDNMGIVQAFNLNTNKLIWSKRVYVVGIDPNIEEDAQLVFIKEMRIENDRLVVIDEHLRIYTLDPNTGKEITVEAAQ
jgi:outer membrane protein assembly factor BamB